MINETLTAWVDCLICSSIPIFSGLAAVACVTASWAMGYKIVSMTSRQIHYSTSRVLRPGGNIS